MVNYDFYHRYTADEHSLRMVRFLEQLADSNGTDTEELAEIYRELPEKFLLKFAFLLMSIGKDHGSQTRCNQITILSGIANRFRLIPRRLQLVSFLIENQNEMIETALHQVFVPPKPKRPKSKISCRITLSTPPTFLNLRTPFLNCAGNPKVDCNRRYNDDKNHD